MTLALAQLLFWKIMSLSELSLIGILQLRSRLILIPLMLPTERMMSSLISIDPNSDPWTASDPVSRNVRKLPVIDDDKAVAIITSSDSAKHIADH